MKCQFCGKDLPEGAKSCDGCGSRQEEMQVYKTNNFNNEPPKNNKGLLIAIIIAIVVIISLLVVVFVLLSNKDESDNNKNDNEITDKDEEKSKDAYEQYILNSYKSAYVDTLSALISATRTKVNEAYDFPFFSTDTLYMVPVGDKLFENSCVELSVDGKSPFSDEWNYAYVGVVYNGEGFIYFITAEDGKLNGIDFTYNKTFIDEGTNLMYIDGQGRNKKYSEFLKEQYQITENDEHEMTDYEKEVFKDLYNNEWINKEFPSVKNINKIIYISPKVCKYH